MNEQPDKFFREKLYGYEKPVSAQTWGRIAKNRNKRNHRWLGIAAAILPLSVAAILLFPIDTKQPENIAAENRESNGAPKNDNNTRIPDEPLPQQMADETASTHARARDIADKKTNKQKTIITPKTNTSPDKGAVDSQPPPPALAELKTETVYETEQDGAKDVTASPTADNQTRKTVTIIFNAEEVNEKYFNKETFAEATLPAKKTSTLKKLLDKAHDLKNNQDPLGEIRQKKNEILALNFRGEKQRNAN